MEATDMSEEEKDAERRPEPPPAQGRGCLAHSCGCLMLLLLLVTAAVGVGVWQREAVFEPGGYWDQFVERVDAWRQKAPEGSLDSLRSGVESVQEDARALADPAEIEQRLSTLREQIARKRDSATDKFREQWDHLARQSQTLFETTRERSEEMRERLQKLIDDMRLLEKAQESEEKP